MFWTTFGSQKGQKGCREAFGHILQVHERLVQCLEGQMTAHEAQEGHKGVHAMAESALNGCRKLRRKEFVSQEELIAGLFAVPGLQLVHPAPACATFGRQEAWRQAERQRHKQAQRPAMASHASSQALGRKRILSLSGMHAQELSRTSAGTSLGSG